MDAEAIAAQAVVLGITELLVLDVADVGMGTGGSTLNLCDRLRERYPKLRLVTGGGVRGPADVERLRAAGLDGVLIASALHDGRFGPANFGLEK